jgi:hypothetical protein
MRRCANQPHLRVSGTNSGYYDNSFNFRACTFDARTQREIHKLQNLSEGQASEAAPQTIEI